MILISNALFSATFISVIVATSLCLALDSSTNSDKTDARISSINERETFLYFAYGSNMKTERIHRNNPTAVQNYIGFIKDHRLDFSGYSTRWQGAVSTIVPDPDHQVWGVVWEINVEDLPHLDEQEGGKEVECQVYQRCELPDKFVKPNLLPLGRQPSFAYQSTMIDGAREFKIPEDYIKYLESFKNTGHR